MCVCVCAYVCVCVCVCVCVVCVCEYTNGLSYKAALQQSSCREELLILCVGNNRNNPIG